MKVKFANAEVDIWKVRSGSVLKINDCFVHIDSLSANAKSSLVLIYYKYETLLWPHGTESEKFEWLEPH